MELERYLKVIMWHNRAFETEKCMWLNCKIAIWTSIYIHRFDIKLLFNTIRLLAKRTTLIFPLIAAPFFHPHQRPRNGLALGGVRRRSHSTLWSIWTFDFTHSDNYFCGYNNTKGNLTAVNTLLMSRHCIHANVTGPWKFFVIEPYHWDTHCSSRFQCDLEMHASFSNWKVGKARQEVLILSKKSTRRRVT